MTDKETLENLKSVFGLFGKLTEEQLIDYGGLTKEQIEELIEEGIISEEGDHFVLLKEDVEGDESEAVYTPKEETFVAEVADVPTTEKEYIHEEKAIRVSLNDLAEYIRERDLDSIEAKKIIEDVYRKAGFDDPKILAETAIYQLFGKGKLGSITGDASKIEKILSEKEKGTTIKRKSGRRGGLWSEAYIKLTEIYDEEETQSWTHKEAVEIVAEIFKEMGHPNPEKAASNFYYQKLRKETTAKQEEESYEEGITRNDIAAYVVANNISDPRDILDTAREVYRKDGKKVSNAYAFVRDVVKTGRLEKYAKSGNPNKVSRILEEEIEFPPSIRPLEELVKSGETGVVKEIVDKREDTLKQAIKALKEELKAYEQFRRKYNL